MKKYFSHSEGYVRLFVDRKFVLEHRYLMEQYLGRKLSVKENVHHINGDKRDNRIENLLLVDRSSHAIGHALQRRDEHYVEFVCPVCKIKFQRRLCKVKWGNKTNQKNFYCSRKCLRVGTTGGDRKEHGTLAAYFHCGPPRCDACKAAMRDYARKRREAARSSSLVQETGLSCQ